MTQAREEQLISDVAETKALLQQFMKEIKPTLATKEEVKAVEGTVDEHLSTHKDNRNLAPVWLGMGITAALSILGFFIRAPK